MPYRQTGFVAVPRTVYIPSYSSEIQKAFGNNFERGIGEAIKSLGNERVFLKNMFFERLLAVKQDVLDASSSLKMKFIVVLADYLHSLGYIQTSPTQIDYVVDPVMPLSDLIERMIGTRLQAFKADDLGGDYASIDTLMHFFPEVIRRQAIVLNERENMVKRLRMWIGDVGFKLLTASELSQAERSFLVIYGNTEEGTKGYFEGMAGPIRAIENKEVLVQEAGALATANCLSGPCTNHLKMISNTTLEQLIYYYGPHIPELRSQIGYAMRYGPFTSFELKPLDAIPWTLESQLTGLSAMSATISIKADDLPPFVIQVPLPIMPLRKAYGVDCLYEDVPDFHLYLTNEQNVADFTWDYMSSWRGRRINSKLDGGTLDYALADAAVNTKTMGAMQVALTELPGNTLLWLTDAATTKVDYDGASLTEEYILPGPKGLVKKNIDMSAHYARMGKVEVLPPLAEFLELPSHWFMAPAEDVVQFVSSVEGLTHLETMRFRTIISLCHNCARYKRLTKEEPPIDRMELARVLLYQTPAS
jgi:hypothetical protein